MKPVRVLAISLLGVAIGLGCVLSPLTVWFAIGIVPVVLGSVRGLPACERRTVMTIVVAAAAFRLLVIAILFLWTDHAVVPFGTLSGDEDYFIKRSLWLGNIARGIPVHPLDLEYAFEPYGQSGHLYLLAFVQALAGPSPYGLRLLGVFFYVLAVLLLYRLVRTTLGRMPALLGLIVLLFLPSLLVWSISVLKEPPFVLISALSLILACRAVQPGSSGWHRALALGGIAGLAAVQQGIRPYGAVFTASGILLGLAIGFVATRPRLILVTLVVAPIVSGAIFSNPDVQFKTYVAIQNAARQHWGAVAVSRGHGYQLLDARFYPELNEISGLEFAETVRFLVRAIAAYVTVPRPQEARSPNVLAYVPEQIVWYILAALVPAGVLFAFRRNAAVTGLLLAHSLLIALAAAFTDGNVGTLVRHRGLALPYLVWLSGVGACELLVRFGSRQLQRAPSDVLPSPWGIRPA
jgi:4-amino-4-deoxy-L-arabinose transferase-like glycosyltransferase